MEADDPGWVPPGVDTTRANPARVYDYWLGGSHNFPVDQEVGRAIEAVEPNAGVFARANRAFIGRAVRFMAAAGIRQFLDIGSGIPTVAHVHEVAQQAAPGSRVVYVDVDPIAIAHSRAILAGTQDATVVSGDLRQPEEILASEDVRRLIDFSQPVGLLLVLVLHFIGDDEDPLRAVATLRDALAPGSYFALSHATSDDKPAAGPMVEKAYNGTVSTPMRLRTHAEILRFFDGFQVVDPGLVSAPLWRPDSPASIDGFWGTVAGVARKPEPRP